MGQGHSAEVPTCSCCSYVHRNSKFSLLWNGLILPLEVTEISQIPFLLTDPQIYEDRYFLSILFSKSAVPAPSVMDWWGLAFWPPPPGAICPVCQDAAYKVLTTTERKASSGMRPEDWTATLLLFHPLRPPLQEVASSLHIDEDPN